MDIWLEQRLHPHSTEFIVTPHYALNLPLAVDRFKAAADWVFSHDEILYAQLTPGAEGIPEMRFDSANAARCSFLDLSSEADPGEALRAAILRQARTPFQMLDSCLARPVLAKIGAAAFCYFCSHHHLLIDGWGAGIVMARIAQAYEALGQGREPQAEDAGFAAYLNESARPLESAFVEKATRFWRPLLAVPIAPLRPVHAGGPNEDMQVSSHVEIPLRRALVDRVTAQVTAANSTFFHACLLAFSWLLRTQHSLDSCSLSLPILNRRREHKETIGPFVELRTIPIPLDENASVRDNLNAIARRVRELFRYYRLPAAELTRLYQSLGNVGVPMGHGTVSYVTRDFGTSLDGTRIRMRDVPPGHHASPMTLFVLDTSADEDLRLQLLYQHRFVNQDEAGLFLRRVVHVLERIGHDLPCLLGDLELVPDEERQRIAAVLNRRREFVPARRLVLEEILACAQAGPEVVAVETMVSRHTYRECLDRAQALAHLLVRRHAICPGDRVALLLPRGAELIVSVLAVMLTGGTFVPIDPDEPEVRARQIRDDCGAKCIIATTSRCERARSLHEWVVLADEIAPGGEVFAPRTAPDQVAYLIYTSGTTGRPKGVEITQRTLADHLHSWFQRVPLRHGAERILLFHSPAFDADVEALFPALMRGNTLVTAPHPQWPPEVIPRVILAQRLTGVLLPPAYLHELLKILQHQPGLLQGHQLRYCLTGGSVMHAETAALWVATFGSSVKLFNVYGPTETTVTATTFEVPADFRAVPGESVPIGVPYLGRVLRIVNGRGRDVPLGAEGELLIGGTGLARGYHGLPAKTAESFVVLEDHTRYYRSGDLVYLRSDGNLSFRRRLDQQVKIRGFRVEVAEVEACIRGNNTVTDCAVLAGLCAHDGGMELRAFVVLAEGSVRDSRRLRGYLAGRLPGYMLPTIVLLDSLPRNAARKVDRQALLALPSAAGSTASAAPAGFPPQGPVQEYLAHLWGETLGVAPRDVRADFFELGGHSLLAAKLISKIGKAFRVDYPFSAFFDQPTIEHTARILEPLAGGKIRLEKMATLRLELLQLSPDEIKVRLDLARKPAGAVAAARPQPN